MLKVVGASWFQTRMASYILVSTGLLGIGMIFLGEYGGTENDGTYSAIVFWNHRVGYRIDFWGQGNDLTALPRGAARAYYKTRIQETGWSTVEIETSPSYPDAVQAYAAGLLEGSLTWQLIHHHWQNTIGTACSSPENEDRCERIRRWLRENTALIRGKCNLLATEDPFWHMVRLFYAQVDGMEAGWKFAVRRSRRRSTEIDPVDFLWLAMATDLPEKFFGDRTVVSGSPVSNEITETSETAGDNVGVIFVKSFNRSAEGLDPILAFAQNTVAPYSKMLRLLKRYTFGYHVSVDKDAPRVPGRSIFMSSYPAAVSSHDEYYVARGGNDNEDITIFAGIPMQDSTITNQQPEEGSHDPNEHLEEENEIFPELTGVPSPVRIMAASRLSLEPLKWSQILERGNPRIKSTNNRSNRLQWLALKPNNLSVWLIEQHPSMTRAVDCTSKLRENGFLYCDGSPSITSDMSENSSRSEENKINRDSIEDRDSSSNGDLTRFFTDNVTNIEAIRKLMRGTSRYVDNRKNDKIYDNNDNEKNNSSSSIAVESVEIVETHVSHVFDPLRKFVFRGDLELTPKPIGVIDTKISIVTDDGLESFEATSGPPFGHETATGRPTKFFDWNENFPNATHIGQPEKFYFNSVVPRWVWM